MKKEAILNRLSKLINPAMIEQLRMTTSFKESIIVCNTVSKIVETYDSTPENEKEVSKLLLDLCKSHFSDEKEISYKQECLKINSRLKLDKYNGMYYIITGSKGASTMYSNAHPTPANAWADCYESLTKVK